MGRRRLIPLEFICDDRHSFLCDFFLSGFFYLFFFVPFVFIDLGRDSRLAYLYFFSFTGFSYYN